MRSWCSPIAVHSIHNCVQLSAGKSLKMPDDVRKRRQTVVEGCEVSKAPTVSGLRNQAARKLSDEPNLGSRSSSSERYIRKDGAKGCEPVSSQAISQRAGVSMTPALWVVATGT
jgi:hypothetical protein